MKKTTKILALILSIIMIFGMFALTACNKDNRTKITVWVSETEGIKTLTEQQIASFMEANPEYAELYKVQVEGISESEAATQMITDVESGADIFCFAQDQLARLVEARALSALGSGAISFIETNNDAGSVKAAKVGDKTYAYPITSDNGYFMYYNKSIVSEDHIDDLAAIVKDCEDANKYFAFELEGSAWYTASFFFATGCTSSWTMDNNTNQWKAADNFNSENGMKALKGMQILTKSKAFLNSSKAADLATVVTNENDIKDGAVGGAAVVISGTWDSDKAQENLGDNYGVTDLPSFTVGDDTYHLSSFSGYKLMGVKPHTDADEGAFCHALAQYLSGKEAQEARFDLKGWGPSNKEVQALDNVKSNEALAALAAQNAYATPQGNIHGGWWDFAKLLGTRSREADLGDEAKLQEALDEYDAAIEKYERMTDEDMAAYGIIGSIASLAAEGAVSEENLAVGQSKWSGWGADLRMNKSEDGLTWTSVIPVVLASGDAFQVRQGQAWKVQFGAIGEDGFSTTSDFKIDDSTAGTYYIKLVLNEKGKGIVSLVPVE